ncbi:MAG: hypothetical protein H8E27_00105 [Verrucomicrobia subdivision 3 bacterium]|nr:hypothetical protein [Limisphaerales bacterium]
MANPSPAPVEPESIDEPSLTVSDELDSSTRTAMRWGSRALLLLAILIAWGAGAWLRAEWVRNADKPEHADYKWEDGYLLTTHDSFFYASVIEQGTTAQPDHLVQHADIYHQGLLTLLGAALVKMGVSLPMLTTWMPILIAPLIVVPVILIGRLYGSTLWGFCAGLLAVGATSYFSRTTPGYFDTDMFAVTWPAMALYLLLRAHREESRGWLLAGALALMFYPFAYGSGASVVIAMSLCFIGYRLLLLLLGTLHHRNVLPWGPDADPEFTWDAVLLVALGGLFCIWTPGNLLFQAPWKILIGLLLIAGAMRLMWLRKHTPIGLSKINRILRGAAIFFVLLMLYLGGPWHVVKQTLGYLPGVQAKLEEWSGSKPNANPNAQPALPDLKFQQVKKTIVEVKETPFFEVKENPREANVAKRVSGSNRGFVLALLGLVLMMILYPEFVIAAPLLGIGIYLAHIAGHRFTIHAVPLAALGATFIPFGVVELTRRISPGKPKAILGSLPLNEFYRRHQGWFAAWLGAGLLAIPLAYGLIRPNYEHDLLLARGRPPVLRAPEVAQLAELRKISKPGDYVLTWWDYGSAVWLYSGRNVLTSPYNQSNDNYIIAKIFNSNSQALAANLARLSVEVFHQDGPPRGGAMAVEQIFRSPTQSPNEILEILKHPGYPVPGRTRDVYLYLPAQMMPIFPVLHQFSERDLATGEPTSNPSTFLEYTAWQPMGKKSNVIAVGHIGPDGKSMEATGFCDLKAFLYIQKTPFKPPLTPANLGQITLPYFSIETRDSKRLHCNLKTLTLQNATYDLAFNDHTGKAHVVPQANIIAGYPALPLKSIEIVNPRPDRPGHVTIQRFNPADNPHSQTANHHLIFSNENGGAYLLGTPNYESNYIQMFLLGQYDPQFFEPVISGAQGRIYRVKR